MAENVLSEGDKVVFATYNDYNYLPIMVVSAIVRDGLNKILQVECTWFDSTERVYKTHRFNPNSLLPFK